MINAVRARPGAAAGGDRPGKRRASRGCDRHGRLQGVQEAIPGLHEPSAGGVQSVDPPAHLAARNCRSLPAGERVRVFGVHLSAVHAAWTEQRRVYELRALLRSVDQHKDRFHVLCGDFNTIAPGDPFAVSQLPMRYRPLMWLSGGSVRWRTVQTVLDAGYIDSFKTLHPDQPGLTLPASNPHIRLDFVFVPKDRGSRPGLRRRQAPGCAPRLRPPAGRDRLPARLM